MARRLLVITPLLLLFPVSAQAGTAGGKFQGLTSQGRAVVIKTDADDQVSRISVRWKSACDEGGTLRTRTTASAPYDSQNATRVIERGSYTINDGDYKSRVTAVLRADRESANRFSGTFKASAVVRQNGRVVDRCDLGKITFDAKRVG